MAKQKSNEQFLKELKECNPNIIAMETYKGVSNKIKFKCLIHDYEWNTTPSVALRSKGCIQCAKESIINTKKDSPETFLKKFETKNPNFQNIEMLECYTNSKTKILCRCKIDGHEWYARPKQLVQGSGCMVCRNKYISKIKTNTNESFLNEMRILHPNIIPLERYRGANHRMMFKCSECHHQWSAIVSGVLSGNKCPHCNHLKQRKSHAAFVEELSISNPIVEVVGDYLGAHTPIQLKCKIHKKDFYGIPYHIKNTIGCPICNISKLEYQVYAFLRRHNISHVREMKFDDCKRQTHLRFDFYLLNENVCIECQGKQHYMAIQHFGGEKEFQIRLENDDIKREYCKNNNITLIEIPYWDIKNIEQILVKELNLNCQ